MTDSVVGLSESIAGVRVALIVYVPILWLCASGPSAIAAAFCKSNNFCVSAFNQVKRLAIKTYNGILGEFHSLLELLYIYTHKFDLAKSKKKYNDIFNLPAAWECASAACVHSSRSS